MLFYRQVTLITCVSLLASCALTPEQQKIQDAKRIKAAQQLQVMLAKQCDIETSQLMAEYFNPSIKRTEKEEALFKKRYTEKVNAPLFQACYKMAEQHYKTEQELEEMRERYYFEHAPRFSPWHFCHFCW